MGESEGDVDISGVVGVGGWWICMGWGAGGSESGWARSGSGCVGAGTSCEFCENGLGFPMRGDQMGLGTGMGIGAQ